MKTKSEELYEQQKQRKDKNIKQEKLKYNKQLAEKAVRDLKDFHEQ